VRRLADERGLTLMEVLVATTLLVVVSAAGLTAFEVFLRQSEGTQRQAETEDALRMTVDRLSARVRNAVTAPGAAAALAEASATSISFVAVDSSLAPSAGNPQRLRHTRYCLDTSTPANASLVRQNTAWVSGAPAPSTAGCPATGWDQTTVETRYVTNFSGGQSRPLFRFAPTSWSVPGDISMVEVDVFADRNTVDARRELQLTSAAALRNVNRPPVAAFSCVQQGSQRVVCSGDNSYDPDGQTLKYAWTRNGAATGGSSPRLDQAVSPGTYTYALTVSDPGGMTASTTRTVTVG